MVQVAQKQVVFVVSFGLIAQIHVGAGQQITIFSLVIKVGVVLKIVGYLVNELAAHVGQISVEGDLFGVPFFLALNQSVKIHAVAFTVQFPLLHFPLVNASNHGADALGGNLFFQFFNLFSGVVDQPGLQIQS